MPISNMFTASRQQLDYVGFQIFNFFPEGWRPATRWDLLSKENLRIKINVDYLIESLIEPGIYIIQNTTRHPAATLELKPWFEAGKVWVRSSN